MGFLCRRLKQCFAASRLHEFFSYFSAGLRVSFFQQQKKAPKHLYPEGECRPNHRPDRCWRALTGVVLTAHLCANITQSPARGDLPRLIPTNDGSIEWGKTTPAQGHGFTALLRGTSLDMDKTHKIELRNLGNEWMLALIDHQSTPPPAGHAHPSPLPGYAHAYLLFSRLLRQEKRAERQQIHPHFLQLKSDHDIHRGQEIQC